jgi:hypothetical protein
LVESFKTERLCLEVAHQKLGIGLGWVAQPQLAGAADCTAMERTVVCDVKAPCLPV